MVNIKVKIENNLYIESDSLQFIIKEYTGTKNVKGADKYITHGYFASLGQAVKHLVKMKVDQSTATTLCELVQDMKRIEEYIHSKIG
ncbi:DUF5405 family protein [Paenibacillus elgii]|uniref:DUF5405 family protein n=1 Tax=Paenibacillus elgii TaxID=189691 RepID=UPI00352975D1